MPSTSQRSILSRFQPALAWHLHLPLLAFVLGMAMAVPAASAASAFFDPVADAEVVSNESADVNLGDGQQLALQNGEGRDREIYLKFEVRGITESVSRATLRVFASENRKGDPRTPVTIWRTGTNWDENAITYRNRPVPEEKVAEFSAPPVVGEWMLADLTSIVRGNGTYSFRLAGEERYKLLIPSRENRDEALRPRLEISTGREIVPPAAVASPARRETTRRDVLHPTQAASIGTHSQISDAVTLVTNGSADPREIYLAFDLPRANGDVLQATLRLHHPGGGPAGAPVHVYSTSNGWTQDDLRWATRPAAMPARPLATARLPATAGWIEFDATPYITGTGTFSFLIRSDAEEDIILASGEDATSRPQLVVVHQDGLNKAVPEVFASGERILTRYSDRKLAADGILDVTKPPYCADPTGRRDSTLAIQRALNEGRDARCVTFLPPGRYRVSDTLEGISPMYRGGGIPGVPFRRREFGCVLKGPGDPGRRPVIELAPHASGFGDPERPKPVIHFWAVDGTPPNVYEKSNTNFSQQIMDLSVDLNGSSGNAGAIGVEFLACEDSAFQCVSVDATGAFAGIKDGLGSGGGMHDISVVGGRYGAYITNSQPTCSLSHATFTGQTVACVYNSSRGPLVMPGAVMAPAPGGLAVVLDAPTDSLPCNGSLCLVDARIELAPGTTGPAITGNRSVYLNNVFVKNAARLVHISNRGSSFSQPGNASGWCWIREYAGNATVALDRIQARHLGKEAVTDVLYIDGRRQETPLAEIELSGIDERSLPEDLQSRHTWSGEFPYHGSPGLLNARDFGATGDGGREGWTDQHPALQAAIDEASARDQPLFLPRGVYRISKSLLLRANTRLVGASHVSTLLVPLVDPERHPDGDFLDGDHPQPLIRTVDDPNATTKLGMIGIYLPLEASPRPSFRHATSYAVLWQAGRNSVLRGLKSVRTPGPNAAPSNGPFFVFRGGGGGKAFALKVTNEDAMTPRFTNCLIEGTTEPLALYHFQPQGASHGAAGCVIRNARNVSAFGIKYEGHKTVVRMEGSQNVRLFGESGGGAPDVLFHVERSRDFVISNITPLRGKVLLGSRSSVTEDGVATGDTHQVLLYRRGDSNRPAERSDVQ